MSKRYKINGLLLLFCCFIMFSCNNDTEKEIETIEVDIKGLTDIVVDKDCKDFLIIPLDDVADPIAAQNVRLYGDKIIVKSMDCILIYSVNGDYIGKIDKKGHARSEYLTIFDYLYVDDVIYINDFQSSKIISYNLQGEYLNSYSYLENEFKYDKLFKLDSNLFVAVNSWNGTPGITTPMFSFINNTFKVVNMDSTLTRTNGMLMINSFSRYKDISLYWMYADNSIYQIDGNHNVSVRYKVDFGKYGIPDAILKEPNSELFFDYITENISQIAFSIDNIYEQEDVVMFTFAYNKNRCYSIYGKSSKQSKLFTASFSDFEYTKVSDFYRYKNSWISLWQKGDRTYLAYCKGNF